MEHSKFASPSPNSFAARSPRHHCFVTSLEKVQAENLQHINSRRANHQFKANRGTRQLVGAGPYRTLYEFQTNMDTFTIPHPQIWFFIL